MDTVFNSVPAVSRPFCETNCYLKDHFPHWSHRPEEPVLEAVSRWFCASQRRLFTAAQSWQNMAFAQDNWYKTWAESRQVKGW